MYKKEDVLNTLMDIYETSEANAIYKMIREAWDDKVLSDDTNGILDLIKRIKDFEPIQYILKKTYFYDAEIFLHYPVLIPRPETEELVHWVIQDKNESKTIWDIGTGSGCIALTLSRKLINPTIIASDINSDALSNLQFNLKYFHTKATLLQHDILHDKITDELKDVEIIVSNPPYISFEEKELMESNVLLHEPHNALFADEKDAIIFYKKIAFLAENYCKNVQKIYLELNPLFYSEIMDLFDEKNWVLSLKKDMQGKNRMLKCERKEILI